MMMMLVKIMNMMMTFECDDDKDRGDYDWGDGTLTSFLFYLS